MNMVGRIVLAIVLSAAQATSPVGNAPPFEDISVVLNDSHENWVSFVYMHTARLALLDDSIRVVHHELAGANPHAEQREDLTGDCHSVEPHRIQYGRVTALTHVTPSVWPGEIWPFDWIRASAS
jgi:hypothetical protein